MSWEYYVKWQNWPHKDDDWIGPRWLDRMHKQKLRNFLKKNPVPLSVEDVIQKEWLTIDRIIVHEYVPTAVRAHRVLK